VQYTGRQIPIKTALEALPGSLMKKTGPGEICRGYGKRG
jgi:hypothetical protein